MSDASNRVAWIVNHYTTLPCRDGAGARHFRLTQELAVHGWTGVLFLASTKHPSGEQTLERGIPRRIGSDGDASYVMLRTPAYGGGVARVRNMVTFAWQLLARRNVRGVPHPDVIVGSTVHLLAAWSSLRLSRRYGVPFVFEIRDIWPETLIDLGKVRSGSAPARLMTSLSRYLCAEADLVISPLPGVRSYLDGLGLEHIPFEWISNGVDLIDQPDVSPPRERADFTVMYLGSHGNANGIGGLLEAFDKACAADGLRELRLRLVGDGTQKAALMAKAAALPSAKQISFEDRIPRRAVLERAQEADALIVNIENLPVYRFGVSLNKLFDYMASGRPTIIATSAINNPIADADAGLTVPAGDVDALAAAIVKMSDVPPSERALMGSRGVEHVKREYGFGRLAGKLAARLDQLVGTDRPRGDA